ncbi:dihydroxyacetone kinase phosphoryl donor subunit DhaM [uncultured Microbacterium sp.]|uniref:dihydroxyacetone kinase phosphoryl donor subunit DhaM n=1 Tax=uncultured Microbacterium sp. TaxID=191216 RepID=UPI0026012C72|nr:dihydroxyacetone kinase phosphoryl donor subunit DhaM [uncultured Microbacterium sp.]
MIGLVAVSHSRALAEAAVHLALQMGGVNPPEIRVAAGGPDDDLGTDAVAIAAAIDAADSGDGVLVLMDLGSAILSAETALEFVAEPDRVRLSPAPFVEGLVAAVVTAAGGADLETVSRECATAAEAKTRQLGADAGESASVPQAAEDAAKDPSLSFEAVVTNPSGLHARPAATFVKAASRHDAEVRIADLETGSDEVSGRSLLALMSLGVRRGARVRVSATGPEARAALDELHALIADGFGER